MLPDPSPSGRYHIRQGGPVGSSLEGPASSGPSLPQPSLGSGVPPTKARYLPLSATLTTHGRGYSMAWRSMVRMSGW